MTKLVVPPMPSYTDPEIAEWGFLGWQVACEQNDTAQREAALADELAEALERIRRNQSCADPDCCSQAKSHERALDQAWVVLAKHKEARNG